MTTVVSLSKNNIMGFNMEKKDTNKNLTEAKASKKDARPLINGKNTYARIIIRNKKL